MWQEEWRHEEGNDYLGHEKTWGVMFMFSIFIVLVVSWVYTYAITSNILNTCDLLNVSYSVAMLVLKKN